MQVTLELVRVLIHHLLGLGIIADLVTFGMVSEGTLAAPVLVDGARVVMLLSLHGDDLFRRRDKTRG